MTDKLDKVRKLLAKAERAGTEAEAAAFTAKATELMLRYQIDEALLGAKHESADELGSKRFDLTGGYTKPKATLLAAVADAFGCKAIRLNGPYGQKSVATVQVYGWTSDLEAVEVLFASLLIQAEREHDRERPNYPGVNGRTFKTSFMVGFANTVYGRLKALRKRTVAEAQTSTPGAEVALYDRSRAVDRSYRQAHPRTRSTGGSQVSSRAGFYSGQDAGRRADLGQSRLGGGRAAIGR